MSTDIDAGVSTFPRSTRLRTPQQFKATISGGRRINSALFRLHVRLIEKDPEVEHRVVAPLSHGPSADVGILPTALALLGISISKRVSTKAVERNRIRRIVRESFRRQRLELPPGDYVLLAHREAAGKPNSTLRNSLSSMWSRAAALKPAGSAPTMPIPASKPADTEPSSPPTHLR